MTRDIAGCFRFFTLIRIYVVSLFVPCSEQTRKPVVRSMNGCSAATIPHYEHTALALSRPLNPRALGRMRHRQGGALR